MVLAAVTVLTGNSKGQTKKGQTEPNLQFSEDFSDFCKLSLCLGTTAFLVDFRRKPQIFAETRLSN